MRKNLLRLTLALIAVFVFASCSDDDQPASKTFVLVHGAWQGAYAWDEVKVLLEKKGHKVVVIELPGHGADQTPPQQITMDSYRDKVVAAINAQKGRVILVGHSMGGSVITTTAEKIPAKIQRLIYIGAFIPTNGQTLIQLAGLDKESQLGPALVPSNDQLTLGVRADRFIAIFIKDGSEAAKKKVADNYRPDPAIPFTHPFVLTAANFGQVDKFYIHTLQDSTIGISLQRQMAASANIVKKDSLATSHCPFFTKPAELVTIMLKAAK